jgi:hypothetical protein
MARDIGWSDMKKQHRLQFLAVTAAWLLSTLGAFNAAASSVVPLDLDQIAAGAQHIVHVRCTNNQVQPDASIGVVTVTTFVVLDRAKGAGSPTFTVRQAGGELNGIAVDYHVPKFTVGSEYVLFMPPASKLGLASPVGLSQGAFSVVQGPAGKEVGNGNDFAVLLSSTDRATAPPDVAARLQRAPSERTRVDLPGFMALMRAKAGTK